MFHRVPYNKMSICNFIVLRVQVFMLEVGVNDDLL